MFEIDLLNGRARPKKTTPKSIAVSVAIISIPFIIAVIMLGYYIHSNIIISITRDKIANYQSRINEMSEAVELQESLEKNKLCFIKCLSSISSSINRHTQWSPVLEILVNNMPRSMILTKLEAKQKTLRINLPNKPKAQAVATTLHMRICETSKNQSDATVKQFKDRLNNSDLLKSKLEQIRVSQKSDTLENKNVVSYGIDCIFKPQI